MTTATPPETSTLSAASAESRKQDDVTTATPPPESSAPATASPERGRRLRRNEEKWGVELVDAGWTMLPSVILARQRALGLDPVDVNILLHLARRWYHSDELPSPRKREIAECMQLSMSTVQRHIARLENDKLIRRIARTDPRYGQMSNAYSFEGLIEKARPFAQEELETRQRRQAEQDEVRKRKRPRHRGGK